MDKTGQKMTFHIITLFPEIMGAYLDASIIGRAQKEGHISIKYANPRDFTEKAGEVQTYSERRVDNKPYGGGPGMVIEAMPVIRAIGEIIEGLRIEKLKNSEKSRNSKIEILNKSKILNSKVKIIFFSPSGDQFTNEVADKMKKYTDIIFVCGRYEGIDARVKKAFPMTDVSVGPYVLTGGELPAMIMIDSITRRIKGVLGHDESIEELRVASPDVYTRPEVIEYKGKKYRVPKVLLSGHHAKMDEWRKKKKSA